MNNLLLNDMNYVQEIEEIIDNIHTSSDFTSHQNKLDFLKYEIKKHSIKKSKEVASANRKDVEEPEKSISSLSDSLAQNTGNTHIIPSLRFKKHKKG